MLIKTSKITGKMYLAVGGEWRKLPLRKAEE
jgi:hypothetical protein